MKEQSHQSSSAVVTHQDSPIIIRKDVEYEEFIRWSAMPHEERKLKGLRTQAEFCQRYDLNVNTPTRWKERPDFRTRVRDLRDKWAFDKTQEVIEGIRIAAVGGNAMSQLLWLQYFEGFDPKKQQEKQEKVEISVGDIRFLIEALPEPLKSEHYANLRKLLDDSTAHANAREVENSDRAEGPESGVQGEANNDAPHVSVTEANAVAESDQVSVRADMERATSSSDHQSTARGGQE